MRSYLFYDIETSGLDPCFDQILTFAAVRTDTSLQILDKISYTIKLRPDIIPSPYAFITHCLTGQDLGQGMNEFSAAKAIHRLFNTPGTISIGYNSLGFDDKFIRFLFYRNLLDPYTHQYADHCARMDMLPVTTMFHLFCSEALKWPTGENGRPSLKLEFISQENQFATSGQAHEAMADVEALIALFKALSEKTDVFEYALNFFDSDTDRTRTSKLAKDTQIGKQIFASGIMVSSSFGSSANYMAPVICIGPSSTYKNQMLWLRLDNPNLTTVINKETGIYDWFIIRKRFGDQWFILPCLDRFIKRLSAETHKAWTDSIASFQKKPDAFLETCAYHRNYAYPNIPDIDPDADLYQSGFFSPKEKTDIQKFQDAPDTEKPKIVQDIDSQRIRILAQRIVTRNFSNAPLSSELIVHLENLRTGSTPIRNYRSDAKRTKPAALSEIARIKKNISSMDPAQQKAFEWVSEYIQNFTAQSSLPLSHLPE